MLRLAPSHPPLWRSPSSLQLGTDGAVRVDGVTGWQERLLDALRDGVPDAMLPPLARSLGATAAQAQAFLAQIGAALDHPVASAARIQAELPPDLGFAEADALDRGWRAAGLDPASVTRWTLDTPDPALPMIVVADRLVEPRRAAALMAADVVHLPIELAGDEATVGPVVVPGRTPCLSCRHARRIDDDPSWPLLASQLIGRPALRTDVAVVLEAAVLAARMLRAADTAGDATVSVRLSAAGLRRVWSVHRPHARCLCRSAQDPARSPAGTATAPADGTRSAPTTTATGFARPA